jgi:CRP-like cAMP-binding protein
MQTADAALDGVALLQPLAPATRAALVRRCSWRRYGPHEQIIDRLDDSQDVFFLVEGRVRIVVYSLSGREISFSDLEPGGFFGELAAIDGGPRSANAVTLSRVLVAAIPPAAFRDVITEHPPVAMLMIRHLAGLVRRSTERITDLSTLAANNRVQAEILRLAAKGRDGNGARIYPIPTHSDIAGRVSTTRETVARVFGELARTGLVERSGNAIVVRNYRQLQDMVEEVRGLD